VIVLLYLSVCIVFLIEGVMKLLAPLIGPKHNIVLILIKNTKQSP